MMKRRSKISILLLTTGFSLGLLAQSSISKDIVIEAGGVSERGISTVSGDVTIGKGARVKGGTNTVSGDVEAAVKSQIETVKTVSGDISLGKSASCEDLETVSGDVLLYDGCKIKGEIQTVSGDITGKSGSEIAKDVTSVSGDVEFDDVRLQGNIITVSGDIALYNGTIVEGDILINRKYESMTSQNKVKVIIDMNSVVKGSIKVKEKDTNVVVYLSNGGKVRGEIINAEVVEQ